MAGTEPGGPPFRCPMWRVDGGSYVLGGLGRRERQRFERHRRGCRYCAAQLVSLADLPGLLARLRPEQAVALAEPAPLELPARAAPVPAEAAPRRGRGRRHAGRAGVTAAAVLLAVALLVTAVLQAVPGVPAPPAPRPAPVLIDLRPAVPGVPVQAIAGYLATGGGVRLTVDCVVVAGLTRDLRLVVADRAGHATQATRWLGPPGVHRSVSGWVAVPPADIAWVQIRAGTGEPLLAYSSG